MQSKLFVKKVNRENPGVLPTKLNTNFRGSLLRRKGDHKSRGQRRNVSEVRARIAYYLSREIGISKAEIALKLGFKTKKLAHKFRTGLFPISSHPSSNKKVMCFLENFVKKFLTVSANQMPIDRIPIKMSITG